MKINVQKIKEKLLKIYVKASVKLDQMTMSPTDQVYQTHRTLLRDKLNLIAQNQDLQATLKTVQLELKENKNASLKLKAVRKAIDNYEKRSA